MPLRTSSRQNALAGLFLFLILFGAYSLSYSGVPAADDEQLFAAAAVNAAETGNLSAEQLYGNSRLAGVFGGIEPLHSLAGSWALRSGVFNAAGRMQALFWLNILYTALTGLVLYGMVLQLGGTRKQAVILALVFGFGTLALSLAKTFFREPLAGLLLTLAVYLLVSATRSGFNKALRIVLFGGSVLCFGAALLTKVLLLAALPALVVLFVLRVGEAEDGQKRAILAAGGLALAGAAALVLLGWAAAGMRMPSRLSTEFFAARIHNIAVLPHDGFWLALAGIFISPGKGLFFYMPVLLVCAAGGFALRRRQPVLFWFPLAAVTGLAVTQALVYDAGWWNMTWGTRFMLPVLPVMVLMGLPVLDWLEETRLKGWRTAFWGLFVWSVVIQLGGVLITDPAYLEGLYRQTIQPVTELILWQARYAPWLGHWQMVWQGETPDLAMARIARQGEWHVLAVWAGLVVLTAVCAAALWRLERKGAGRKMWVAAGALGCAMLVMTGVSMRLYQPDPAWYGDRDDFALAVGLVETQMQGGDGVVISPYLYPVWYYAMNEAGFGMWYSWPVPGDEGAAQQALEGFIPLAEGYMRVWLIEEASIPSGDFPAAAQFREEFDLLAERAFGEDVRVSLYEVE